ncbi:MAG: ResA-like WAxxUGC motif-containing protein, partial [Actinomycetota bacterium]
MNVEHARPWHERAQATHPSVVDTTHATNAALGFTNIPMAVWIDEDGTLVRPAESASIERSPLRDMAIPDELPERLRLMYRAVKEIPDDGEAYRAAILDWVRNGATSPFALRPDEVIERSQPRSADHARAS